MAMTEARAGSGFFWVFVLVLVGLVAFGGCAGSNTPGGWAGGQSAALERFASAREAFLAADFERAGDLFETLTGNRTEPALAKRALLGLACARLAVADSDQETTAALELWKGWLGRSPRPWPEEDGDLLLVLLTRLSAQGPGHGGLGNQTAQVQPLAEEREPGAWTNRTVKRGQRPGGRAEEPAGLRLLARDKARENEKLTAQVREKNQEIERLRKQLNALERLHQEMNAKMKVLE